jgi:hypothetical protein
MMQQITKDPKLLNNFLMKNRHSWTGIFVKKTSRHQQLTDVEFDGLYSLDVAGLFCDLNYGPFLVRALRITPLQQETVFYACFEDLYTKEESVFWRNPNTNTYLLLHDFNSEEKYKVEIIHDFILDCKRRGCVIEKDQTNPKITPAISAIYVNVYEGNKLVEKCVQVKDLEVIKGKIYYASTLRSGDIEYLPVIVTPEFNIGDFVFFENGEKIKKSALFKVINAEKNFIKVKCTQTTTTAELSKSENLYLRLKKVTNQKLLVSTTMYESNYLSTRIDVVEKNYKPKENEVLYEINTSSR